MDLSGLGNGGPFSSSHPPGASLNRTISGFYIPFPLVSSAETVTLNRVAPRRISRNGLTFQSEYNDRLPGEGAVTKSRMWQRGTIAEHAEPQRLRTLTKRAGIRLDLRRCGPRRPMHWQDMSVLPNCKRRHKMASSHSITSNSSICILTVHEHGARSVFMLGCGAVLRSASNPQGLGIVSLFTRIRKVELSTGGRSNPDVSRYSRTANPREL
jgi:hypothetical protein